MFKENAECQLSFKYLNKWNCGFHWCMLKDSLWFIWMCWLWTLKRWIFGCRYWETQNSLSPSTHGRSDYQFNLLGNSCELHFNRLQVINNWQISWFNIQIESREFGWFVNWKGRAFQCMKNIVLVNGSKISIKDNRNNVDIFAGKGWQFTIEVILMQCSTIRELYLIFRTFAPTLKFKLLNFTFSNWISGFGIFWCIRKETKLFGYDRIFFY